MAYSCCFLLHFLFIITLIIFLAFSPSNGENVKYAACKNLLYSCGDIKNVGYPFWGENRPKFCGISYYKLRCYSNTQKFPEIAVYNDYFGVYGKSSVHGINISSHTMVISQDNKLFGHCHFKNLSYITLLSTLKLGAGYTNVTLFYGCNKCTSRNHHSNSFSCINSTFDSSHSANGTAYYFGNSRNTSDISSGGKWCSCENNATFLVDKRGLDELKDSTNANASLTSILTKWPIQLEYMANFTACSKCEKSGGKCGSPDDESSNEFVCYCRDGIHTLVCPKSDKKLDIALGLGIGGGIFVLVTFIAIWFRKKKSGHSKFRTRSASLDSSASDLEKGSKLFGVPLFSYSQLVEATGNFDQSNELGSGGFGTVYYGKLKDGREVAVKRLYEKNYKRLEQFMNEIQLLTGLRHKNLVLLHGCTSPHSRELLLVYEYVENGTVADHLYGENTKSGFLPWPVRLRIAIETATALSYLHASDIIHRDVKTNNILLDSNFSVKVADFGLSRLFPTDKTHVSTAPQGTPGYLDPEYHQCYQLTNKSDVYSFGVVLIELVSSLPAIDMDRHRHEINLSNYAMNRIKRCAFDELVDPQLGFASDFKVRRMTILVAELAFQCLQHDKEFRPSMDEVLEALKKIESADYEALQAEEMVHNAAEEVVKMHVGNTPMPSPTEDDHAKLLSNHQLILSSPISMIDKWISGSTTSSSSK